MVKLLFPRHCSVIGQGFPREYGLKAEAKLEGMSSWRLSGTTLLGAAQRILSCRGI